MPEFQVEIAYTSVDSTLVTITANTADEAEREALAGIDDGRWAYEKWYSEDTSDYTARVVSAPSEDGAPPFRRDGDALLVIVDRIKARLAEDVEALTVFLQLVALADRALEEWFAARGESGFSPRC